MWGRLGRAVGWGWGGVGWGEGHSNQPCGIQTSQPGPGRVTQHYGSAPRPPAQKLLIVNVGRLISDDYTGALALPVGVSAFSSLTSLDELNRAEIEPTECWGML